MIENIIISLRGYFEGIVLNFFIYYLYLLLSRQVQAGCSSKILEWSQTGDMPFHDFGLGNFFTFSRNLILRFKDLRVFTEFIVAVRKNNLIFRGI